VGSAVAAAGLVLVITTRLGRRRVAA
jgi:hypothetical protein